MASPFEQFFDPSNNTSAFSSMTGTIGRLFGLPTQMEREAQAEAETMRLLSGYNETAGSPQKAILRFFQTPEGVALMGKPGASDIVEKWYNAVKPTPPVAMNVGPGQTGSLVDPNSGKERWSKTMPPTEAQNWNAGVPIQAQTGAGGTTNLVTNKGVKNTFSQPPAETQNWQAGTPREVGTPPGANSALVSNTGPKFSHSQPTAAAQTTDHLVGMLSESMKTPDILDALITTQMTPAEHQLQSVKRAQLVQQGVLSAEDAALWDAKLIQVVKETNAVGQETGRLLYINFKNKSSMVISGDPSGTVSVPSGGTQPHTIPAGAITPEGQIDPDALTDKKYMGLAASVPGQIVSILGTVVRSVNPSNNEPVSQQVTAQTQRMNQLETAILGLNKHDHLKIQASSLLKNLPSLWSDPQNAYIHMEQIHNMVDRYTAHETATYKNVSLPIETRKKAQDNLQLFQQIKDSLPTREDVMTMRRDIRLGTAGAVTPASAAKAVGGLVLDAGKSAATGIRDAVKGTPTTPPASGRGVPTAPAQPAPAQPQAPAPDPTQPQTKLPTPAEIGKLDETGISTLREATGGFVNMPSELRLKVIERIRAIKKAGSGKQSSRSSPAKPMQMAGGTPLPSVPAPRLSPFSPVPFESQRPWTQQPNLPPAPPGWGRA